MGQLLTDPNEYKISSLGYFLLVIGGYNNDYIDDVELVPIDPALHPVPDCLSQLNPLPLSTEGAAGALDYSGKSDLL